MSNLIWSVQRNLLRGLKKTRYTYRKRILRYNRDQPLVFGIGDSRTGTLSLSYALQDLGVPTVHWPRTDQEPNNGWIEWINNAPYQGFVDHPISDHYFFKELHETFPDAKFVLTTRDEEAWKRSVSGFFQNTPIPNESDSVDEWYQRRREHEEAAIQYFDTDQLAVIPVEAENKWERLCSLLDHTVPNKPYPHSNKGSSILADIRRF